MTTQNPKILLSEGSSLSSREAITAFGLAGHRVELLSSNPICLGRFSRFVTRVHQAPASGADPDGYLAAVIDAVRTHDIDALIPVHEQAYLFAAARKQLPAGLGIALADFEAFEQVQSKASFAALLTRLQVPQPATDIICSADEFATERPYPFFVKAAFGTASAGVWRVGDIRQRDALLVQLERHNGFAEGLLVQAAVIGPIERTQAVFDHGRLVASHIYRQVVEGPGGGDVLKISVNRAEVRRTVERIGQALTWHGALSFDYILDDATRTAHFIDANPRLVEPMNAWLSGVDLPGALLQVSLGEKPPTQPEGREGVLTRLGLMGLLDAARQRGRRRDILREIGWARLRFGAISRLARGTGATAERSMVCDTHGGSCGEAVVPPRGSRAVLGHRGCGLQPDTFSDPSATRMAPCRISRTSPPRLPWSSPPRSLRSSKPRKYVRREKPMARLKFGAFLAPHHPIGEHPMLQFRRDLDFVEQIDALGFDEFWCGEHHSSGWEMIASPEMFLAAAGERTKRIKLGTGVVSLPYHHPFNVAQRMVQLDHMTGGRAIFGSGPGALASDAHTLGIDPMTQRDRQDEAIGIIRRLFNGERVTAKSDWFTMNDAALQLLPLQEEMPFVVASQISPSGMTLAGKYGIGIISLGSMSTQGLMALPTQWGFAEDAAKKAGTTVSRANWRVLLSWHIAETREQARREAGQGLMRWHNEYNVGTLQRPGLQPFTSPEDAVEKTAGGEAAASTIGTPDDLVKTIKSLMQVSGGVGTIVGFVHDWANPENTRRSWDMVARYVIPEINGYTAKLRESQKFLVENRAVFERAGQAVMAKIMENDKAAAALPLTGPGRVAIPTINAPDLQKEAAKRKA